MRRGVVERLDMKRIVVEQFKRVATFKSLAASTAAAAALSLGCARASAQETRAAQQTQAQSQTQADEQTPAQKYFTDVSLVNQDGETMRLYSDLLKGKVVVIDFFFATCQGTCLPMNRNLQKVQDSLGDRLGKDVYLISISVDPAVDTPARLKEYAKKLNARPGWYFLTGEKASVDFALRKLGQYVENKQDHTNIFIIGNERTGLWKKAFGLAKPDELIKVVDSVIDDRPAGGR
ncbi:MAG TPA: SCO family protein [Pyrinomonadaceae bacterium]|nr:SCO family protein [Pyrinomonadaceae bacterium]